MLMLLTCIVVFTVPASVLYLLQVQDACQTNHAVAAHLRSGVHSKCRIACQTNNYCYCCFHLQITTVASYYCCKLLLLLLTCIVVSTAPASASSLQISSLAATFLAAVQTAARLAVSTLPSLRMASSARGAPCCAKVLPLLNAL